MPKVWQKYTKSESLIGLWEITESEQELVELACDQPAASLKHETRRLQWLASRSLLRNLMDEWGEDLNYNLQKDEHGSPWLNGSNCRVSISHAGDYAAIALSRESAIGIDVERMSPRINRIRQKFMNEQELDRLEGPDDLAGMHLIWSAKEALFKYHPDPGFDFRSDLFIDHIAPEKMEARIVRGNNEELMEVPYTWHGDYVLAWALPKA